MRSLGLLFVVFNVFNVSHVPLSLALGAMPRPTDWRVCICSLGLLFVPCYCVPGKAKAQKADENVVW